MYQARRRALRFDKGALAQQKRGCEGAQVRRAALPRRLARLQRSGGCLPMDASVMFVDCPAYMDNNGAARCGLPAEVHYRYTMNSTDGPLESAKISCPCGHHFNGPIDCLTVPEQPAVHRSWDEESEQNRSI